MRSGRLRHRLVVERPIEAESTNGERITDWEAVTTIKADLERLRGSEREEGPGPLALPHVKISAKWRPALAAMTAKWRLRQEHYAYDLISVGNVDMANRELTIYAKGARIVEIVPFAFTLTGLPFAVAAVGRSAALNKGVLLSGSARAAAGAGLSAGLRKGYTLLGAAKSAAAARLSATLRKASILTGAAKAATGVGLPAALDWDMETSFVLVASPKAASGTGVSASLVYDSAEEGVEVMTLTVTAP